MPFNNDLSSFLSGGGNRVRPEKKDLWKVILWVILFFVTVVIYVLEFQWFSKIFGIKKLILIGIGGGLILGLLLSRKWTKNLSILLEKVQVSIFITVLSMLIFPLLLSLTNRLLSRTAQLEEVEFIQLKVYHQGRFGITKDDIENGLKADGYFLFFVRNEKLERIKLKTPHFLDNKQGEIIQIPIKKGLLGFEFVNLK